MSAQQPSTPVKFFKYSVSRRVILELTFLIVTFTGLTMYSLLIYRQTVAELDVINSTHVPLALGTAEIQSTQVVFNTLMDRLSDEPNSRLTRDWLNAARQYRPATLARLVRIIEQTIRSNQPTSTDEIMFLTEIRQRLQDVRRRYRLNESKFSQLFSLFDMGKLDEATANLESLKRSERHLNRVLSGIGDDVKSHIKMVSHAASEEGNTALVILAVLGSGALLVAGAIIFSTKQILAPLGELRLAVAKVAGGNFNVHTRVDRADEIGALAASFNTMTDALRQRDQQLIAQERLAIAGRIAAQVTHEIRNPLSSLEWNADLLMEEIGHNTESADLISAMQDEIERLTRITGAYLRFARLPTPALGDHRVDELVNDVARFMQSELSEKGVSLYTRLDAGTHLCRCDKEQIRQVLINLIKNAVQAFTHDRGLIEVNTSAAEDVISIAVTDDGPGIPKDQQDQIFDPFYTTKSDGTGLGLATVRQICLAHNGNITYTDNRQGGSTFIVTLPTATKK